MFGYVGEPGRQRLRPNIENCERSHPEFDNFTPVVSYGVDSTKAARGSVKEGPDASRSIPHGTEVSQIKMMEFLQAFCTRCHSGHSKRRLSFRCRIPWMISSILVLITSVLNALPLVDARATTQLTVDHVIAENSVRLVEKLKEEISKV